MRFVDLEGFGEIGHKMAGEILLAGINHGTH